MTKKILFAIAGLAAAVAVFIAVRHGGDRIVPSATTPSIPTVTVTADGAGDSSATAASNTSSSPAISFEEKAKTFAVESTEAAREEVAKNPHDTPKSVEHSARKIADLYASVGNAKDADVFLDKMKDCSQPSAEVPVSIKAICLKYTSQVATRFPELRDKSAKISSAAPEKARQIEKFLAR